MDRLAHLVALVTAAFAVTTLAVLNACVGGSTASGAPSPDAGFGDGGREASAMHVDAGAPPRGSEADRGAEIVRARGCVRCHQSDDPSDGLLAGRDDPRPGTLAYPKNLTPDETTGLGDWSDRLILRAIRDGVDDDGRTLCEAMPRYPDIDDDEGAAIVAYLRDLEPVRHAVPPSRCGDDARDGGASDGEVDAGRDAGHDAGDAGTECVGLAGPTTKAACHACGDRPCQANGCFGGYICELKSETCHPLPPGCIAP